MGTNYYALPDVCECCDRPVGRIHIGKSGSMLRGYLPDDWSDAKPDVPIASWADWKAYLRSDPKMQLEDEYGQRMTVDELIDYFESTPLDRRRRQYDWMIKHGPLYGMSTDGDSPSDILEPDGFSLCFREFS